MKLNTDEIQTAKLIDLGFEKPKNRIVKQRFDRSTSSWIVVGEEGDYSIGELIEMFPTDNNIGWNIRKHNSITDISKTQYSVIVDVNMFLSAYTTESEKLIDALYEMIVKLKEEGVI